MSMVLGEDDRLPGFASRLYPDSLGHKDIENLPDRVLVEHPVIYGAAFDRFGEVSIRIGECFLIECLLFFIEIGIRDPIREELKAGYNGPVVDEEPVLYRLREFVTVCRDTGREVEELIGVPVDLIFGCCCKADEEGVEVGEYVPVLVVDAPVGLVYYYHVEMPGGVEALSVLGFHLVDCVCYRLVRREYDPGVYSFLVLDEITERGVGEKCVEAPFRLS